MADYGNNARVSVNELKAVVKRLKNASEDIKEIYSSKIMPIIENSSMCISLPKIECDKVEEEFRHMYSYLNDNLLELFEVLDNTVIPSYEVLIDSLTKSFNQDFVNKLSDLLNVK